MDDPIQEKNDALNYDPTNDELYSLLPDKIWGDYMSHWVSCKMTSTSFINEFEFTSYFVGLNVQINGQTFQIDAQNDVVNINLIEGDLTKTMLKIYSTLPLICKSNAVECDLEFKFISQSGGQDLIRLTDCDDLIYTNGLFMFYLFFPRKSS